MPTASRDPKVAQVIEAGAAIGLDVHPVTFSAETRTAADAAREVGCEIGQIVKSLVFQAGDEPLLFLVSGANRLDTTRAMTVAGVASLTKADAERAKAATGYSIGATPPFGHAHKLRMFMDKDLMAYGEVWAAAGRPDSVFAIAPETLASATGAIVCSVAVTTT